MATDTLNDQISAAIRESLPAKIGDELKQQLALIPKLKMTVAERDETILRYNEKIGTNTEKISNLSSENMALRNEIDAWKRREDAIKNAERDILVAQMDRQAANQALFAVKEVVGLVFRNPVLQRTAFESAQYKQEWGNDGRMVNTPTGTSTTTTETTT
jgi:septal ring factor EnvC (AmiA/AmiB activator)